MTEPVIKEILNKILHSTKETIVTSVHKSGNKKEKTNFKRISLVTTFAKNEQAGSRNFNKT